MKTATILPIAIASAAALAFSSCALDPDYAEYKKKKAADAASTNNPYGAPAAGTTNPYGVPQAGGETGSYTPAAGAGGTAPYQPLPGVTQPNPSSTPPYTPAEPAVPTTGGGSHTVVSGDSLWAIARKYGASVTGIQAANNLTSTDIFPGQTLIIPAN